MSTLRFNDRVEIIKENHPEENGDFYLGVTGVIRAFHKTKEKEVYGVDIGFPANLFWCEEEELKKVGNVVMISL